MTNSSPNAIKPNAIYTPPARLGARAEHYRLALGLPGFALGLSGFVLGQQGFLDTNMLVFTTKCSRWESRPTRGLITNGFALQRNIGLKHTSIDVLYISHQVPVKYYVWFYTNTDSFMCGNFNSTMPGCVSKSEGHGSFFCIK